MNYYMLEQYEWLVKSKNYELTRGFFVNFSVNKGTYDECYPLCCKKDFAFCPSRNFQEFQKLIKNPIYVVPEYIQLFDKSELESLYANIPLQR